MADDWFKSKWKWLKRFGVAALAGVLLMIAGGILLSRLPQDDVTSPAAAGGQALLIAGILACVPLIFWLSFIPILHWKDRYRGTHSNIWGALMVFETSGWTRVVYWFVHVLTDANGRGVYAEKDQTSKSERGTDL